MIKVRPFLKWAGSKYRIIEALLAVLPPGKRLVEPFAGSAAVFLNTQYPTYLLAETNPDLVNVYRLLQSEGKAFIDYCRQFFLAKNNHREQYYKLRALFNETEDIFLRAALFLYLNRHGYNGLCRYNQQGKFNVPFGHYANPYFPEKEMLFFHNKAKDVEFAHASFVDTLQRVQPGDVVYCDPPYAPLSATASFTHYHTVPFASLEQEILAQQAQYLAEQGIPVIVSNHDTPWIRTLYRAAKLHSLTVSRPISCKATGRGRVAEVIAVFAHAQYPHKFSSG